MAHGSFPIEGEKVELTETVANRMGFINLDAMKNWQRLRESATIDNLLVRLCNLEQMVIESKKHIEEVDRRTFGMQKIG